jgi:hypothetical protein
VCVGVFLENDYSIEEFHGLGTARKSLEWLVFVEKFD